jgi:hypothetical protein
MAEPQGFHERLFRFKIHENKRLPRRFPLAHPGPPPYGARSQR